jgi:hypothetical protein
MDLDNNIIQIVKPQVASALFHNNKKPNDFLDEIIQTSFLLPIREDEEFGDGNIHPEWKWSSFQEKLYDQFGGWTMSDNLYLGGWINPKSKERVRDISRKYFVDVKRKDFGKLISLLSSNASIFLQNCIRLEYEGKIQDIKNPNLSVAHDSLIHQKK